MKLSICITYYYKRNSIFKLIKVLNKIILKSKFEILIRNDNPKLKLKIKNKKLNLKIFNEKKKSIGEQNSLLFLKNKSKGDFICFISDDDLISEKFFNIFLKDKRKKINYLSICTKNLKFFNKNSNYNFINNIDLLNDFFSRKVFLSGTIGFIIYKKNIKNFFFKNIKKYNFDTFLLIHVLENFKIKFLNHYFGYNNMNTSNISNKIIDLPIFIEDLRFIKNKLSKINKFLFFKLFLNDFYSIIFRKKKIDYISSLSISIKFMSIFKSEIIISLRFIILILFFYTKFHLKFFLKILRLSK